MQRYFFAFVIFSMLLPACCLYGEQKQVRVGSAGDIHAVHEDDNSLISSRPPSQIPVKAWPPGGMSVLREQHGPVIVHDSPVHEWEAMRWSEEQLARLEITAFQAAANSEGVFIRGKQGMRAPPHVSEAQAGVRRVRLSAAEFMRSRDTLMYTSVDVAEIAGSGLEGDFDRLIATPECPDPTERMHVTTKLWFNTPNTSFHAHCDGMDNVFVQIYGRKTFYLWPPAAHAIMHPYPDAHSLERRSQLHRPLTDASVPPLVVELWPGDLLYLPKYWWHHVRAEAGHSIGLNTWATCPSTDETRHVKALPMPSNVLPPGPDGQSQPAVIEALAHAQYIRKLLAEVHGSVAAARRAAQLLLATRFDPLLEASEYWQQELVSKDPHPGLVAACTNPDHRREAELDALRAQLDAHLDVHLMPRAKAAFGTITETHGVRDYLVTSFVQHVIRQVTQRTKLGRDQMRHFLKLCCIMGW